MAKQLEELIGEKLVIGFPGTKVTDEVVRQFKETYAGGVIFYRINFESPQQLRTLITDLENALGRKLLVCVDHEGGRVIMYREGITVFPDNLAIGHTNDVAFAKKAGEIAAKELRALGTDVNFAPVLDVLTDSYSPNIGIRSYGKDWKLVAEMGSAYIKALQAGGVSATAKHFPGKGHAPVDAHLKLPTINSSWEEMKKVHLQPFIRSIKMGIDVIMSSHPNYPKLDPLNIATFSRRIITDCLRDELGFKGLVSSDDLEMGAVGEICPIDVAAVRTAAAGHDLILSCHDFVSQRKAFQGLFEAYRAKFLPLKELEESAERILHLKAKRKKRFEGEIGPLSNGKDMALQIAIKGSRVLNDKQKLLPIPKNRRNDIAVVFPKLSYFASKIMVEKEYEDEPSVLHRLVDRYGAKPIIAIYPIEPSEKDTQKIAATVKESKLILFFCFDAHLYPNQQKLLKALQNLGQQLVVALMRDPYDGEFLKGNDVCVTGYGWRHCQIQASLNLIYGPA